MCILFLTVFAHGIADLSLRVSHLLTLRVVGFTPTPRVRLSVTTRALSSTVFSCRVAPRMWTKAVSQTDLHDSTSLKDVAHRRGLRAEFSRLWLATRLGWTNGKRPWLGVSLALASVAVALMVNRHVLSPELWRSGDVYAALPLNVELMRLPMSLFMPTAYLPLWGAIMQLVVVIGLGELILGRSVTLLVAATGHLGSTLLARLLLESPHAVFFGLAPTVARLLDTGPSGATTAVGACLLVALRMNRAAMLLILGLLIAAVISPGLDAVEHSAALITGLCAGAATRWVYTHPLRASWVTQLRNARVIRFLRRRRPALAALRDHC
jgi:hypothetical protein